MTSRRWMTTTRVVVERTYTTENGGGWRELLACGHVAITRSCVRFGEVVKRRRCVVCFGGGPRR